MTSIQPAFSCLGIDASNIRAGGGVTHLVELLRAAEPREWGFKQIIVWGGTSTLRQIEDRSWLLKAHEPLLDQALPLRMYWQRFRLEGLARRAGCGLLFVPGGTFCGAFHPFVTMSRNLLPFDWAETWRYGVSWMFLKLQILRQSQSQTMRRADGVIFLTEYARTVVVSALKQLRGAATIIPHGVNRLFDCPPRAQKAIETYSPDHPFRFLYVSTVTVYKHQWHVAEAVAVLRKKGLPVHLELVGPAYRPALRRLCRTLQRIDPDHEFIHYRGPIPYTDLNLEYQRADAFVFASTCEAFGQIVTEAMSAGLPIACSNTGTMRELLGEHALYFNPEQPPEIAQVLETMAIDPVLRTHLAWGAYKRSQTFTWERCARDTFDFIAQIGQGAGT